MSNAPLHYEISGEWKAVRGNLDSDKYIWKKLLFFEKKDRNAKATAANSDFLEGFRFVSICGPFPGLEEACRRGQ